MRELPRDLSAAVERSGHGLSILVVRLGAMGDILRTVPAVRLLHRALPAAGIHWLLESQWQPVLDGHPDLAGVIPLPRKHWRDLARTPLRWSELVGDTVAFRHGLRERRFDLSLDFHGNLRSGLVASWADAPVRLGYDGHQQKEGNRLFSTHRVPAGERRTSRIDRNLDLVRALGIPAGPLPSCDLPLAERGAAAASDLVGAMTLQPGGFAVVSPGASAAQAYKTPPADLLAAACVALAGRGLRAVVVYGPGELPLARAVVDRAKGHATLAPPTDLPTLAGLTRTAAVFVGGDSGPLHLACAVGCPVLGVYGPTDPEVNRPWGVPHRTAFPEGRRYTGIKSADRTRGFEGLTVEALVAALHDLLDEVSRLQGDRTAGA